MGLKAMDNIEHATANAQLPAGLAGGRVSVQTVERLHRLLGGEAHVEVMVLQFIASKYGARNLLHLPSQVATAILQRPADFLRTAKQHCEPELNF